MSLRALTTLFAQKSWANAELFTAIAAVSLPDHAETVHNADDALKMLLAGADVVHMASALLRRGPQVLTEVLEGMTRWMEAREYDSVSQLKGSMSQQNLPDPSAFARASYLHALDSFTPPPGVRY